MEESDVWGWGEEREEPLHEMEWLDELLQYIALHANGNTATLKSLREVIGQPLGDGDSGLSEEQDVVINYINDWRLAHKRDLRHRLLVPLSNWVVRVAMPAEISWTQVKPSTIPGAGYGLFAAKAVPQAGVNLTVYGGDYYRTKRQYWRDTGDTDDSNRYILRLKDSAALLDGRIGFYLREQGRWANTMPTEAQCNASYVEITDRESGDFWQMRIESTRAIAAGEEIFAWYGEEYARELFSSSSSQTKRAKLETPCIECGVREATHELLGHTHLIFCGQKCAKQFWHK